MFPFEVDLGISSLNLEFGLRDFGTLGFWGLELWMLGLESGNFGLGVLEVGMLDRGDWKRLALNLDCRT